MNAIVDTHVLVWALRDPSRISKRARDVLNDAAVVIHVSVGCAYEIEFKRARDVDLQTLPHDLERAVIEDGFDWLAIDAADMVEAARLPVLHRDPWDRILIGQARRRGWSLISADARIGQYDVPVIW